jgi:hypothetical protein
VVIKGNKNKNKRYARERDGAFGYAGAWDCNVDHNDVPQVSEQIQGRDNNQKISPLHQTTCTPLHPKDGRFDPTSPTSIDSS